MFSTVIPNPDPCGDGGESRLMEIDALSGGEADATPFDVTGNGVIDDKDFILINGVKHNASGVNQGIGITKQPTVIESPTASIDYKYSSGSSAAMGTVVDRGGSGCVGTTCDDDDDVGGSTAIPGTRRSWRQLNAL